MRINQLTEAFIAGIKSLPNDVYLGLKRTAQDLNFSVSNKQIRQQHYNEDYRFFMAITNLIRNRQTLSQMASLIVDDLLNKLPEPMIKKIHGELVAGGVHFISRSVTQIAITTLISSNILRNMGLGIFSGLMVRTTVGFTFGGIATQGCIARSSAASRRLQQENMTLWLKLRYHNYDMLYFLFEEPVSKMNQIINNPLLSQEVMSALENR